MYARLLLVASLPFALTACPKDPAPTTSGPGLGERDGGDGDGDVAAECEEDATQRCDCDDGTKSTQLCLSGQWNECNCDVIDETVDSNKDDSPCQAGYYTGSFTGTYWSGVFELIPGTGSVFPVTVDAVGKDGKPGLALTIEEMVTDQNSEFPEYKVGDGCIVGVARALGGIAGDHPFVGILRGELDCPTGQFTGTLKGYYELFGDKNNRYNFEGPLGAQYKPDATKPSLGDGKWKVAENKNPNAPGGDGTWMVGFVSEKSGELADECAALLKEQGGIGGNSDAGI